MKKYILFIGLALGGIVHESKAGGFKIGLQGQKQLGMGHTGVGFAQDAATIYFNPAGMSFIGSQFTGGMFTLIPSTSFLEKGTNTITNATSQVFTPFEVFATTKLSDRINFGVGVYTPFGSGVMYPTDWSGRNILHRIDLKAIFIQPTLSLRITNNFSIGAGFVYSTGSVLLEKDLPIVSGANQEIANVQLKGNASGIGFNAGAYLKATDKFNIGVTYHSKVNMRVKEGKTVFEHIPSALESSFPSGNTFKTDLPLPSELAAGISYKASHRTTIALDMNYTFWNSFDSLGFDYAKNSASLTDAKSPRLYKNAIAVRAGIQYKASKNVMLRLGAFYDQTPLQDGYVAPELPDNDKLGFTCGASFKCTNRLSLDMSFLYEHLSPREQTNKETGLSGTFKTKAIAPGIGINYLLHKKSTTN